MYAEQFSSFVQISFFFPVLHVFCLDQKANEKIFSYKIRNALLSTFALLTIYPTYSISFPINTIKKLFKKQNKVMLSFQDIKKWKFVVKDTFFVLELSSNLLQLPWSYNSCLIDWKVRICNCFFVHFEMYRKMFADLRLQVEMHSNHYTLWHFIWPWLMLHLIVL